MFAGEIRRRRVNRMRGFGRWWWHPDQTHVKLNGKMIDLWRAVDQESEILDSYVTKTRKRR